MDSYKFSGKLVVLDINNGANVTHNGRQINSDNYFDNVVTTDGSDSRAEYTVTLSGRLKKTSANGATVNNNDTVSGTTASGRYKTVLTVTNLLVEITEYNVDGSADVLVNGKPI